MTEEEPLTSDFWRRVRERDAELPRDADGKVSVDHTAEDSAVIPDDKAHEPLPEES